MIALIIAAAVVAEILLIIFLPVVGWSILALLALAILVLLFIPLGVHATYIGEKLSLAAKISRFEIKLYPKEGQKKEKNKKAQETKAPSPAEAEGTAKKSRKLPFNFEELLELVKKALRSLRFFGRMTVHKFMLHYIAAGSDPYKTAMTYNYVNAALSGLAPVCAQSFKVKSDVDVWTNIDFTGEKMFVESEISISLRIVQLLKVALVFAFGALGVLIKNRIRLRRERQANINNSPGNNTDKNNEIKTEERMDSNG